MNIVSVQEMRAIERASVEHGVSLEELQGNAARAVADEIEERFEAEQGPVLVLAGPGNNGRDALIAADLLQERLWTVRVYLAPRVGSEDVLGQLHQGGAPIHAHSEAADLDLLRQWIGEAAVVIDGLLGIGIRGAVREPMAGIIATADEAAAARGVAVVAVDLPSGVDADTGEVLGSALHADYTVSLGCVKSGILRFPAAEYVGTLVPADIGLPTESYQAVATELLDAASVQDLLPPRPLDGHKGSFGRVLVVAGSRNFVGAPYLVGAAAARSGCGLVTFAVPEWQRGPLVTLLPEATYLPLLDWEDERAGEANAQAIVETLPDCSALAIGPGLGQGPSQTRLVMAVLEAARGLGRVRVVVDADGLNTLAAEARWWEQVGPGLVLTPHPGEMARLTGLSTVEVNADRWATAREAAQRWGQTVVLKGAFTMVADPGGEAWVSPVALPALASGGTGDVLTGLIAGLMAQGAVPTDAARAGVFLHAAAAQETLATWGTDRLLAGDLPQHIPVAIRNLWSTKDTK